MNLRCARATACRRRYLECRPVFNAGDLLWCEQGEGAAKHSVGTASLERHHSLALLRRLHGVPQGQEQGGTRARVRTRNRVHRAVFPQRDLCVRVCVCAARVCVRVVCVCVRARARVKKSAAAAAARSLRDCREQEERIAEAEMGTRPAYLCLVRHCVRQVPAQDGDAPALAIATNIGPRRHGCNVPLLFFVSFRCCGNSFARTALRAI